MDRLCNWLVAVAMMFNVVAITAGVGARYAVQDWVSDGLTGLFWVCATVGFEAVGAIWLIVRVDKVWCAKASVGIHTNRPAWW